MHIKDISMPNRHKLWLYFFDKELENEFQLSYEQEIRIPLRFGIIISILSWLSALFLVYSVIPDQAYHVVPTVILIICPFYCFIVFATFKNRFQGWIHFIGAISNLWAGLFAIYFCGLFPEGESFTVPVLIFIVFFGSYMVRLRWIATLIVSFSYSLAFHIYAIIYTDLPVQIITLYTFILWLTWLFAGFAGHVSESKDRIRFIQRKMINEQQELIKKEKEASDNLLLNILPPLIAQRLKAGEKVIADKHENVSILFADMVGFTNFSSNMPAEELIIVLNQVFSKFDELTEKFDLEKIKTIGDGYMVAGGLTKSKENHLLRIVQLGLEMISFVQNDPNLSKMNIELRIGIHTGPVAAGVIGKKKFSYDLWGDTVNTGARMEANGETGKVCVSEEVKLALEKKYAFEQRELIEIKGKGLTQTYFVKNFLND